MFKTCYIMNNKINNFRENYNECESMVKKYIKYIENGDILDIGSNVGLFFRSYN
jgi:2-polyprenyl-3-methyl-5-hydroxy-6-metoxy-1,4-benzoquinol methylase